MIVALHLAISCVLVPSIVPSIPVDPAGASTAATVERDGEGSAAGVPQGDTCQDPFVIPALPFSTTQGFFGFHDDYDELCPAKFPDPSGGPDFVYRFAPTTDTFVDFYASGQLPPGQGGGINPKVWVYEDTCPTSAQYQSGSYLCCNDDIDAQVMSVTSGFRHLSARAGHSYFFVVDFAGGNGPYVTITAHESANPDCDGDGVPDTCQASPDCQHDGVPDACQLATSDPSGNVVPNGNDRNGNGVPDECDLPGITGHGSLLSDPAVRALYIPSVQQAHETGDEPTALRVKLIGPYPYCPGPEFADYEAGPTCGDPAGCVRWVGPIQRPQEYQDSRTRGSFRAARLQCTPYYHEWSLERDFYILGADIVPSSFYEVQRFAQSCIGDEQTCLATSVPISLLTMRWGDVASPIDVCTSPNALDVVELVNKFKGMIGTRSRATLQLQPNALNLFSDVNARDIQDCVDAFKGREYPYSGPCPCPSTVPCNVTPCSSDSECNGGVCVRVCLDGPAVGLPCVNDLHCGQCIGPTYDEYPCLSDADCPEGLCSTGACGPAFCRDRCGRCTP